MNYCGMSVNENSSLERRACDVLSSLKIYTLTFQAAELKLLYVLMGVVRFCFEHEVSTNLAGVFTFLSSKKFRKPRALFADNIRGLLPAQGSRHFFRLMIIFRILSWKRRLETHLLMFSSLRLCCPWVSDKFFFSSISKMLSVPLWHFVSSPKVNISQLPHFNDCRAMKVAASTTTEESSRSRFSPGQEVCNVKVGRR